MAHCRYTRLDSPWRLRYGAALRLPRNGLRVLDWTASLASTLAAGCWWVALPAPYLDAIALVFPVSLAIGRIGCALAHDHPGRVTTFPLGFSLENPAALAYMRDVYSTVGLMLPDAASSMGFHDLDLYELLYLALVVIPLFGFWSRRDRPTGFYLTAFAALYLPVRFCLDMLRVADGAVILGVCWACAF